MFGILAGITSAVTTLMATITSAGAGIAAFIGKFTPLIEKIVPVIGKIIKVVGDFASLIIEKPENEQPEEIGKKAEIGYDEGIKPENYESTQLYLEDLRKKIKLDQDEIENMTPSEKAKYQTVGTCLYMSAINEKLGITVDHEFYETVVALSLTANDIKILAESMKKNGVFDGTLLTKYFNNELEPGNEDRIKIYNSIRDMYHVIDPTMNDGDINAKIVDLALSYNK